MSLVIGSIWETDITHKIAGAETGHEVICLFWYMDCK